jgi:hypothetical protein
MRTRKLLSIVFLTFATCSIFSCNLERVPETFLIDKDFRGCFYIIYNQKGGQKKKFEGESRVYEIPKTGVLFTEFEPDWRGMTYHNGRTNQRFYFVDEKGIRKEISPGEKFDFKRIAPEDSIMVDYASDSAVQFSAATGEMGLNNGLVKFDEYYIGPYDMLGVTKGLKREYIDSLRAQVLKLQKE